MNYGNGPFRFQVINQNHKQQTIVINYFKNKIPKEMLSLLNHKSNQKRPKGQLLRSCMNYDNHGFSQRYMNYDNCSCSFQVINQNYKQQALVSNYFRKIRFLSLISQKSNQRRLKGQLLLRSCMNYEHHGFINQNNKQQILMTNYIKQDKQLSRHQQLFKTREVVKRYQGKSNYICRLLIVHWHSAVSLAHNRLHQIPDNETQMCEFQMSPMSQLLENSQISLDPMNKKIPVEFCIYIDRKSLGQRSHGITCCFLTKFKCPGYDGCLVMG